MGNDEKKTTMWVKESTKKRLGTFGTTNDTYDEVLTMLMDKFEGKK